MSPNKIDFHIHIKLSKQNILKRRLEFIKENEQQCKELGRNVEKKNELFVFNQYTFPYYLDTRDNKSTINYYINANNYVDTKEQYDDKVYDDAFDYLMNSIQRFMDEHPLNTDGPTTIKKVNGIEMVETSDDDSDAVYTKY
jgi:hypothetical protein